MASAARAAARREARYEGTLDQYVASGHWPTPRVFVHGVCARCGRYTQCTLPAKLCNRRCMFQLRALDWAVRFLGGKL